VKAVSIAAGLFYTATLVFMESRYPGAKLETQIVALTVPALYSPIILGVVSKGVTELWFWLAMLSSVALHIVFLSRSLPLPNTFAAIIVGGVEGLVLTSVTGIIRDLVKRDDKGRSNE
jgi:hypothetical protein